MSTLLDLPMGPDYDNFYMDIYARVSDTEGSTTQFFIDRVQVDYIICIIIQQFIIVDVCDSEKPDDYYLN